MTADALNHSIKMSKSLPLDFSCYLATNKGTPQFLDFAQTYMDRWRRADFHFMDNLTSFHAFAAQAPLLESFRFAVDDMQEWAIDIFNEYAPKLRDLTLLHTMIVVSTPC